MLITCGLVVPKGDHVTNYHDLVYRYYIKEKYNKINDVIGVINTLLLP